MFFKRYFLFLKNIFYLINDNIYLIIKYFDLTVLNTIDLYI